MGKGQHFPVKPSPPNLFSSASFSFECSNPIYGQTRNPFDLKKTPGGSSGGEGALLSKGGSILGMGTDTGGSIRIPCGFCGVYGLRTSRNRLRYSVVVLGAVGRIGSVQPREIRGLGNRGACSYTQLSTRGKLHLLFSLVLRESGEGRRASNNSCLSHS